MFIQHSSLALIFFKFIMGDNSLLVFGNVIHFGYFVLHDCEIIIGQQTIDICIWRISILSYLQGYNCTTGIAFLSPCFLNRFYSVISINDAGTKPLLWAFWFAGISKRHVPEFQCSTHSCSPLRRLPEMGCRCQPEGSPVPSHASRAFIASSYV